MFDPHLLSAGSAADSLGPDEARQFESHLSHCEDCRRSIAEFRATFAILAAASAESPPPHLKRLVMAQIEVVRQIQPVLSPLPANIDRRGRVVPGATRVLAAVGLVALLAGAAGLLIRARGDVERLEQVQAVLVAADLRTVELQCSADSESRLAWSPVQGAAVFVADGLGQPPATMSYQLWLMIDGTPVPLDVFVPDEDGDATILIDRNPSGADAIAVTVEPAAGSAIPTPPIILAASLGIRAPR
ncbi:MAG: anti-sigma-K factor RskA [Candidatus Poriferisodalaceae bacterium]|jgi:anti-sigma-K factor RskA